MKRLAYLDWLRFFIVLSLTPFHAALSYTGWGGVYVYDDPIRDQIASGIGLYHSTLFPALRYFTIFMDNWFMHLLFLISGIGAVHSLDKRDAGSFIGERALRLTLPLGIGTITVVPIQSWLRALDMRAFSGGFFSYLPRYFATGYEWGHLWFLGYLFAFSVVALPLFLRWKRRGRPASLVAFLSGGPGLLAPALLFGLVEAALRPGWPGNYTLVNDWACVAIYLGFFALGYLLGSEEGLLERVEELRLAALALGLGCFACRLACGFAMPAPWGYNPGTMAAEFFRGASSWALALAALGLGRRWLGRGPFTDGPAYGRIRDLSFPQYFFHYPLITAATWLLLGSGLSVPLRWAISVAASWAAIPLLTELARLARPLRRLFGIRDPEARP
jgi:glucans biosynthesis protein C